MEAAVCKFFLSAIFVYLYLPASRDAGRNHS